MFKRVEKNDSKYSLPAKRARYDTKRSSENPLVSEKESTDQKCEKFEDFWGEDFAEEELKKLDLLSSEACSEDDIVLPQQNVMQRVSHAQHSYNEPTTSKAMANINVGSNHVLESSIYMSPYGNQRKKIKNLKDINTLTCADYQQFENNLMEDKVHNSTLRVDNSNSAELHYAKEMERLKLENKKLLEDFITKEGETLFLRNQLKQTQLRIENDKLQKTRFIEEQESRHRSEMDSVCKQKEQLETQLKLQKFELEHLTERFKLLENGNIKLIEPQSVHLSTPVSKSKPSPSNSRSSTSRIRQAKVKESCAQTSIQSKSIYHLRISNPYFPLVEIPKFIYDPPLLERPVIDIKVTEKTGQRNLPILQEDDTSKIFENPELARPLSTMTDGKRLTVEFVIAELAALQQKTSAELDTEHTIPLINKLISVARELMLNAITVLQTIFRDMKNDDIRDMNDILFSELYATSIFNGKSICSASAWHACERGIEIRRIFGILSYVASESTYLSKYVAGKTTLLIDRDENYKCYSERMTRYNAWSVEGQEFEMLKIILQFVTLVGSTRRAHQFSGLLCAIMMIICNVHKKVEYCSLGMQYVYNTFKEIVFCRPLPYCYTLLSNVIIIFGKSATYLQKLCINSQSMAVSNWKGSLHFTPDACPLQIFLVQVENYEFDLIAAIEITDVLLNLVQYILHMDIIQLRSEVLDSCNCCMKLLRFTIKTLCKCSQTNLSTFGDFNPHNFPIEKTSSCTLNSICGKHAFLNGRSSKMCIRVIYQDKFSDENDWANMKRRQSKVLRDGIRFLSHLAICDPDFVIRFTDIEDAFYLFMRNLNSFENFILHENEQEAMNRITQTFILDKAPQSEMEEPKRNKRAVQFDIKPCFESTLVPPLSSRPKEKDDHSKFLITIKSLFKN